MPSHPRRRRLPLWLAIAASLLFGQTALAEAPETCPQPRLIPQRTPAADLPTNVRANEASGVQDGINVFTGDVELTRGDNQMQADRITYDSATDMANAEGNVTLKNYGDAYRTQKAQIHVESRKGYVDTGTYTLERENARGSMQRVDFLDRDHARLTGVRYTTCPPGQDSWFVHARSIDLDNIEETGTAHHAWVDFQGVPLAYMPRFSFPISNKRRSGFLVPQYGTSNKHGVELAAPYYLNLAPNYDDTVTPRLRGKRGLQLQNEFRYLGRDFDGQLDAEILPSDRIYGQTRTAGIYKHNHTFSRLWSGLIDVRGVSDREYLEDFSTNLNTASTTHLPQNAETNYRGTQWNFTARLSDYQTTDRTITSAGDPYARLPQLVLNKVESPISGRLQYHLYAEAVRFDKSVGIVGDRLNLIPAVSYPLFQSYGFLTPKIGMRYITYSLSRTDDTSPSVQGSFFSLDGGLFFDRDMKWGQREYTHTLEPRLYYLYTPYKSQNHIPNFDSGAAGISIPNLFRDHRFDGGDRIGDANQLSLAVTSRILDGDSGVEYIRGSMGRIYYFDDRKVNIPENTAAQKKSDTVGEAVAKLPGNWYASVNILLEQGTYKNQQSAMYLQYNPERNKIFVFGQRFTRNSLHQRDISFEWPLIRRWTIRARAYDSLRDDRTLESHVGVEYNACCWAFRVFITRRLSEADTTLNRYKHEKSIGFELELTGLAKRGEGIVPESPLQGSMFTFPSKSGNQP